MGRHDLAFPTSLPTLGAAPGKSIPERNSAGTTKRQVRYAPMQGAPQSLKLELGTRGILKPKEQSGGGGGGGEALATRIMAARRNPGR